MKFSRLWLLACAMLLSPRSEGWAQTKGVFVVPRRRSEHHRIVRQDINGQIEVKISPSRPTLVQFPPDSEVGECHKGSDVLVYKPASAVKRESGTIYSAISVTVRPQGLTADDMRRLPETWLNCQVRNSRDAKKNGWVKIDFLIDGEETYAQVYLEDIGTSVAGEAELDMSAFEHGRSRGRREFDKRPARDESPAPRAPSRADPDTETIAAVKKLFEEGGK